MLPTFDTAIVHGVVIRAPREQVFETLTRAEGWDAWFTRGMELDLRPGGSIVFRWKEWGPEQITTEDYGEVVDVKVPERFAFTWHSGETMVEIELADSEQGTEVWLIDSGYPDTPEGHERMLDCAAGWGEALTLLKFYVEHGLTY
ncbi:MAG: SRPBCC domain-containing protein [bacterium]|nr:SRPBCC domain-containing protein [bacterium]